MRSLLVLLIGTWAFAASTSLQGQPLQALYTVVQDERSLSPVHAQRLRELREDPISEFTMSVNLVNPIETATLREFYLPLGSNRILVARTRGITRTGEEALDWQGTIGDDSTIVSLLISSGDLRGRFRADNSEWRFEPIGADCKH